MDGVTVELIDRPELGYTKNDKPFPRGELKVQSSTISPGYYNNPEETAKAFVNGFFHTGDICSIDEEGKVKVLDRAKAIVILPSGKTYFANRLETTYVDLGIL